MKSISTGAGLAILGLGIAVHPLLAGLAPSATASAPAADAAVITPVGSAQAGPTIVWFGVTEIAYVNNLTRGGLKFFRLWSDGRLEYRYHCTPPCGLIPVMSEWIEIPPPPGGNGFACRTDINGDRVVDGADLSSVLNAWGQQGGCEPDATYPCLDLGNLAGGVAMK